MSSNYLSAGNSKLGKGIYSFSLPPKETCAGSTEACRQICYAGKSYRLYPSVRRVYARNLELTSDQIESQILKPNSVVRLHVSGDFKSPEYIHAWRRLAKANPSVRFYAYTRAWRVPSLLPSLEALRSLPNVQILASVDEDTGMPPKGWRFAMMGQLRGFNAPGSIRCPEQAGKVQTCDKCGICFKENRINITLRIH